MRSGSVRSGSVRSGLLLLAVTLSLALWLVVLPAEAQTLAPTAAEYTLEMVQVVHRHGSRSPLTSYNATAICGETYPCGILNREGQRMLVNTGAFLRERYTDPSQGVVETPFFAQQSYNLSVSTSRSTDVLRTLQSADGLLRGLFPDLDAYYPAIHTIDRAGDYLLRSSTIPEVVARMHYGSATERALCDPLVDALFPDFSELQAVGAEVYSAGYCANRENRTKCAMQLCDIGRAYEATGQLTQYPLLNMRLNDVCSVLACSSAFLFGYHPEDKTSEHSTQDAARGSFGQPLAQQMLRNIRDHLEGRSAFRLYEYSAHDTTISPLAVTFGDSSWAMMEPPFASTFVLELLRRKNRNGATTKTAAQSAGAGAGAAAAAAVEEEAYAVRLLFGHPGTTPMTNFSFAFTDFEMRCLDPEKNGGQPYVAAGNVCPLADFVRFINASAPQSPEGLCLVTPSLLAPMRCDPALPPAEISDDCRAYRRACPVQACGAGYTLSYTDACVWVASGGSTGGVSGWVVCLLVVLGFGCGAAALYAYPLVRRWWKGAEEGEEEVVIV